MSGYAPQIEITSSSFRWMGDRWNMGAAYLCCLALTYALSLLWIVVKLSALMAEQRNLGAAAAASEEGAARIMELVFSGWDHLEYSRKGVAMQRATLVRQLREENESAKVSEAQKLTVSRATRRRRRCWRVFGFTLSFLLLGGGIATIFWALSSPELASLPGAIGTLAPTLVISVVNGLVPTIVKNVVWLEGWPSEVTLRHQMGRIFLIKMLNILVLFAKVHSTSGETGADQPCHATVAGKTFMQLIVSDFFVATFSASVPQQHCQTGSAATAGRRALP